MTQPSSGISAAQAQLFVALMQAQSQSMAAAMSTDPTTADGTASTQDFAALLTTVLGTAAPTTTASPPTIPVAGTGIGVTTTPTGNHIAAVANQLAADLRGANFTSYDASQTPAAAQAAWNTPGWGNGNVQCVAFVDGVYRQAGIDLPAHPNGADFWGAYNGRAGWSEVANGQGLPQPG
nr:hypothetical protein [Ktedonobacterales bacterium]